MSLQAILTGLLLPPLLPVLLALGAGLLAWRGRRWAGLVAAAAAGLVLLLATPFAAGVLTVALEARLTPMLEARLEPALEARPGPAPEARPGPALEARLGPAPEARPGPAPEARPGPMPEARPGPAPEARPGPMPEAPPPAAIVVLGAEMAHGLSGPEPGPLTLERLRAAAALHRATGLPLLVTGGPLASGAPPIAALMAESLARDFGTQARWVEPRARDTRENATLSAAMLRAEGIGAVLVVSHAWHLPRALEAFARAGLPATPAPLRRGRWPDGAASDFVPRPDHLAQSWLALREWAGRLVYRLRDGA